MKYRKFRLEKPFYLEEKDDRYEKHMKQIEKRGFADDELWSFDNTLAEFILPRLIEFRKHSKKCIDAPQLHKDIKKMIKAFKLIREDCISTDEEQEVVDKGLRLFSDNFRSLWT